MLANWVKQPVVSGGTGNLTLGGAATGYVAINTAIGLGPRFSYVINDGSNRETGIGYLSAETTLVRETVLETLASGVYDKTSPAALDVTTSANVVIAPVASQSDGQPYSICGDYNNDGYIMDAGASGSTTLGALANRIYMMSFYLPCRAEVAGMGFEVTTAASGNAVAGIYQAVSRASAIKIAQTGEMATGTTGVKTASFAAGNLVLNPGYHIVVLHLQASCSNRANTGSVGHLGSMSSATTSIGARFGSLTYGATLPSALGSDTFTGLAGSTPRIILLGG